MKLFPSSFSEQAAPDGFRRLKIHNLSCTVHHVIINFLILIKNIAIASVHKSFEWSFGSEVLLIFV